VPELQYHERRADFFAGQHLEVGQFLPGPDADAGTLVTSELGRRR
jgi:hypothetical protein